MADDQALHGPPAHLAPGTRGRTKVIASYHTHGCTEKFEKNWRKIGIFYFFAYFSSIFWILGFFYSVAGRRDRSPGL